MTALVAAELLKLRTTRAGTGFLLAFLALQGVALGLVVRNEGRLGAPSAGTAEHTIGLLGSGGGATMVLLVLGVVVMTTEFRHSTLTAVLLVVPDRARLVWAKAVTVVLIGVVAAVGSVVVALAVRAATGDLTTLVVNREVLLAIGGVMLALPAHALIGLGVGALVRQQTPAVVAPVVWFVAVEALLPAYGLRSLAAWLPGGAAAAMARDAARPGLLPAWAGAVVLAAWALLLVAAGLRRVTRTDVT